MTRSGHPPLDRRSASLGVGPWRRWTTPYDVAHPDAAAFRSLQVQATIALTPWSVFANFANLLVAGWTFRDLGHPAVLGAWMLATSVCAAAGVPAWRRWKRGQWPAQVSARTVTRASYHAVCLAGLWAVPAAWVYSRTSLEHRPLVVGISVGMICAGGFALFPLPRAAFSYVVILTAGLAGAFWSTGEASQLVASALLVGYSGIVLASVVTSSRHLGRRMVAEAESARQKRLVDLLLDDFQENARDWLWELDASGGLQHVSPRLVDAFGRSADELRGRSLVELLLEAAGPDAGNSGDGIDQLTGALHGGNAFRDLQVSLVVGDRRRWWALTGKRLFDERGQAVGWRGVGADVTRSRQQNADLVRLANVDALTGLANRHQFRSALGRSPGRAFTLFYLDLDDFKAVNDLHGHQVGDRVLGAVAARFRGLVRSGDVLARIGGDEFALLSWQTLDSDGAAILATRLIDALRQPIAIDDLTIRVGTSIGIVHAGPHEASGQEMTRLADMALYEAKARGRNTYAFFHASMEEAARRRNGLIADLHGAIDRGEFELQFQALVTASTGELSGAESLIRWRHPRLGLLTPAEFVPLAEESGHVLQLGQWVLRQACREAVRWPPALRVAVNLSTVQFSSPTLIDDVRRALDDSGLPPDRLELEITESLVIRNVISARATLARIRALGARVALDDFGTGYSSLSNLRALPLDTIKIDGSFVHDITADSQAVAVVSAVVGLARALRMSVTVEGVETPAQLAVISGLGVDDVQGFLLARPASSTSFLTLVTAWQARPEPASPVVPVS